VKVFDLTKSLKDKGEKEVVTKIWGLAFISVPVPANTNGLWRK